MMTLLDPFLTLFHSKLKRAIYDGKFFFTFPSCLSLITRCQFYYMDQFLLSASSNQLFVHQIGLPPQSSAVQTSQQNSNSQADEFWFKYVHQVKLENCKNITAICAPNQVKMCPLPFSTFAEE